MDPALGYLETPTGQHPYIYTANNPLKYRDPSGELDPLDVVFLGLDAASLANDYKAIRNEGWTTANRVNLAIDVGATMVDLALLAAPGIGGGGHLAGEGLKLAFAGARGGYEVTAVAARGALRAGQYGLHAWQGGASLGRLGAMFAKSHDTLEDAMRGVDKWNVDDSLKVCNEEHVDAAQREKRGEVVKLRPDGRPYNHIKELQDHMRHLDMVADRITDIIKYNHLRRVPWDPEAIEYFKEVLGRVNNGMEWLNEALH